MSEKNALALQKKREAKQRELIAQLRKTPIVQFACERTGIGRSTYYKWRGEDFVFAQAADHALAAGRFLINDLAESRLLRLVQDDNLTAIIFWLKNNHPQYAMRYRNVERPQTVLRDPSYEEKILIGDWMIRTKALFESIEGESAEDRSRRVDREDRKEQQKIIDDEHFKQLLGEEE